MNYMTYAECLECNDDLNEEQMEMLKTWDHQPSDIIHGVRTLRDLRLMLNRLIEEDRSIQASENAANAFYDRIDRE